MIGAGFPVGIVGCAMLGLYYSHIHFAFFNVHFRFIVSFGTRALFIFVLPVNEESM